MLTILHPQEGHCRPAACIPGLAGTNKYAALPDTVSISDNNSNYDNDNNNNSSNSHSILVVVIVIVIILAIITAIVIVALVIRSVFIISNRKDSN